MQLPALYPPPINGYYVSGDVAIAPDAIIAPGVIVMADPHSRITIASGVCLGLGSIVHAYGGTIAIREGAILGAGVLLVGVVEIGRNACLGPSTTVFNGTVGDRQLLQPGSLVGITDARSAEARSFIGQQGQQTTVSGSTRAAPPASDSRVQAEATVESPDEIRSATVQNPSQVDHVVYGKDYFLRMRLAMFPQGVPGSDASGSIPDPWSD
jgi:carbon dioxide concentrating mechanism protein CcmN